MPLVRSDQGYPLGQLGGAPEHIDGEDAGFFTDIIPAAFRTENIIGSVLSDYVPNREVEYDEQGRASFVTEEGFNPLDEDYIAGYEEHAYLFAGAGTRAQGDRLKARLDRERRDRQILAENGVAGFVASLGASIVDPSVLIPVGGSVRAGASMLKVALRSGAATGLATIPQEFALHATQEYRTLGESAINVGGATVLGGILGGAVQGLSNVAFRRMVDQFNDDMRVPADVVVDDPSRRSGLMDSAAVDPVAATDLGAGGRSSADLAARINEFDRIANGGAPDEFEFSGNAFEDFVLRGSFKAAHRGAATDFVAPDEVQAPRYDGDGGSFGDVLYLDQSGEWVSGAIGFGAEPRVLGVEVNADKMFLLTPQSINLLRERMGVETFESGRQVVGYLKGQGFDGVFVRGFDRAINDFKGVPDRVDLFMGRARLPEPEDLDDAAFAAKMERDDAFWSSMGMNRNSPGSAIAQDQVIVFNPKGRVRVIREDTPENLFETVERTDLGLGYTKAAKDGAFVDEFLPQADSVRRLGEEMGLITPRRPANPEGGSVGAARVDQPKLDDLEIHTAAGRVIAKAVANPFGLPGRSLGEVVSSEPVTRTITSQSTKARRMATEMVEIGAQLSGEVAKRGASGEVIWGRPRRQPLETKVKVLSDVLTGGVFRASDDHYIEYLYGRKRKAGDIVRAGIEGIGGRSDGKLTRPEFNLEVGRALRRGDQHDIPEVAQAAQWIRKNVIKPLEDEAVRLHLFGSERVVDPETGNTRWVGRRPDVSQTAQSYFMRLYDREKIIRDRPAFERLLVREFQRMRAEAEARVAELDEQIAGQVQVRDSYLQEMRDALKERARLARDARKVRDQAERDRRGIVGRAREALTQSNQAQRRREQVQGRLGAMDLAYFRGLLKAIKRGYGEDRPVRLMEWVRSPAIGGISDAESMVARGQLGRQPGIINKNGMPLDNIREAAIEDGYYKPGDDYLNGGNLNEFVELLMRDAGGNPVYAVNRPDVADAVADMENLLQMREDLARAGLDYTDMTPEDLASFMMGRDYTKAERLAEGRVREARLREEQAGRRLRAAQDKLEDQDFVEADAAALARTLRELMPEQTERLNEARKQHRLARRELEDLKKERFRMEQRASKTDEDLADNARTTTDNILSNPAARVSPESEGRVKFRGGERSQFMSALSGRFKERELEIPDEVLEPYLVSDVQRVMRAHVRSMVPDMEIIKTYGSVDMEEQLFEVAEEMAGKLPADATGKQASANDAARDGVLMDLMGMRDRIRGVYGMDEDPKNWWSRLARNLVSLNYLRLMGGVTISSLPDAARAVFTYGMGRSMALPFKALTGNLASIKGMDAEFMATGGGFEMVLNTRVLEMTDLVNDYGGYTKMERVVDNVTANFGYASLIGPWNRAMKGIASYGVQQRLIAGARRALNGQETLADADMFARLGMNRDQAVQIARKVEEFGDQQDGQWIARSDMWGDETLRGMWLNAIRKEVDDLIVTPGQTKPLLASTTWGRVLLQFRSYNMAATQKVLIRYTQGVISAREAHVYMMLVTQLGLGAVVAHMKASAYGIDTSNWNERKWMVEALDRSGLLAALVDLNLMVEYGTGGRLGLSAVAGQGPMSRYASRNALGNFMGPSAGLVQDAFSAMNMGASVVAGDEPYRSDIRAARRMLPFQNLWFLRDLFDRVEDGVGDALGAEGESLATRRERLSRESADG